MKMYIGWLILLINFYPISLLYSAENNLGMLADVTSEEWECVSPTPFNPQEVSSPFSVSPFKWSYHDQATQTSDDQELFPESDLGLQMTLVNVPPACQEKFCDKIPQLHFQNSNAVQSNENGKSLWLLRAAKDRFKKVVENYLMPTWNLCDDPEEKED